MLSFFPERSDGLEGLMAYAVALSISLLGRTVLALRLPTALASAGTVFFAFRLGRLLFEQDEESGRGHSLVGPYNRWCRPHRLMAVSISQTTMGRIAFRTALFATLSVPVSGHTLDGMEATKLVANRAVRRMRRAVAVQVHSCASRSIPFLVSWLEFH